MSKPQKRKRDVSEDAYRGRTRHRQESLRSTRSQSLNDNIAELNDIPNDDEEEDVGTSESQAVLELLRTAERVPANEKAAVDNARGRIEKSDKDLIAQRTGLETARDDANREHHATMLEHLKEALSPIGTLAKEESQRREAKKRKAKHPPTPLTYLKATIAASRNIAKGFVDVPNNSAERALEHGRAMLTQWQTDRDNAQAMLKKGRLVVGRTVAKAAGADYLKMMNEAGKENVRPTVEDDAADARVNTLFSTHRERQAHGDFDRSLRLMERGIKTATKALPTNTFEQ